MGYFKENLREKLNLAAGREVKVIEMTKMINKLTDNDAGIKYISKRE